LAAFQLAKGVTTWVDLLPELAMTINTTTSCALPRNKTPFEVWFGRKPHWITARTAQTNNQVNQDNEDEDSDQDYHDDDSNQDDSGDEDLVLTEIETRVAANNARLHARMIKANSGRSPLFVEGSIATLKIPPKLRLKTEGVRLPVHVLEYKNGQYKLQSRHGRLAGRYQG